MNKFRSGFTIVELIIVVTVIGILAAIVIVGYSNWRSEIQGSQVRNDLNAAASAMTEELSRTQQYPAQLPASFSPTEGVGVLLYESTPTKYCIDAVSLGDASKRMYIDQSTAKKGPQEGTCAGRTVSEVPHVPKNLQVQLSGTVLQASWQPAATTVTYNVRCGTNSDITTGVVTSNVAAPLVNSNLSVVDATPYFCEVAGTNGAGQGKFSVRQVGVPAATAPHDIAITGHTLTPNQIITACQSPSNAPAGYNVVNIGSNYMGSYTATSGNDIIYGGAMGSVSAGSGNDIMCLGSVTGSVYGNDGHDVIIVQSGTISVYGGNGSDVLIGLGSFSGALRGDADDDIFYAQPSMGSVNGDLGYDKAHVVSGGTVTSNSIEEWF